MDFTINDVIESYYTFNDENGTYFLVRTENGFKIVYTGIAQSSYDEIGEYSNISEAVKKWNAIVEQVERELLK